MLRDNKDFAETVEHILRGGDYNGRTYPPLLFKEQPATTTTTAATASILKSKPRITIKPL